MRLLEAPQTWIAAAVVLLVIALVLLLLARRQRRASRPSPDVGAQPAPSQPAPSGDAPVAAATADGGDVDPPTGPIDLSAAPEPVAPELAAPEPAAPESAATVRPAAGSPARDRLLAALLDDPDAAVDAVDAIDRANGSGPPGASVAALLRAGMSPAQVASLCGVRESALAEIVARDLGLLTGRNATDTPGRAWASAGSAAGSTTSTTG